ncbi:MAG: DUF1653 domain-containing protein [Lachnospiraceae bacterium]|nr:DUF1653 domain-containing protein [Lachnospiraceae bacterium]
MSFIPRPQEIYKHFKGNLYQIVAIAEHSETGEQLVIYQALYGDFRTYARPLPMFTSKVDHAKYPEVTQKFRFALQGPESHRQERESQPESETCSPGNVNIVWDSTEAATGMEEAEELTLDPMVLEFLDADTYEQRLNILASLQHRITDEMITTMAIACDIEVNEGALEERYDALKGCLLTLEKYECNRMR